MLITPLSFGVYLGFHRSDGFRIYCIGGTDIPLSIIHCRIMLIKLWGVLPARRPVSRVPKGNLPHNIPPFSVSSTLILDFVRPLATCFAATWLAMIRERSDSSSSPTIFCTSARVTVISINYLLYVL